MPKTYTVKDGDTLSKIAEEQLGDANRWPEIVEANKDKIKDPNVIQAGLNLVMPAPEPEPEAKPKSPPKRQMK